MFKKCVLLFLVWLVWSIRLHLAGIKANTDQPKVVFCDVGQGDAILISWGEYQLLIDGGPDNTVLRCLREEMPPGDAIIEAILLTHPDADHFEGLTAVLGAFNVKRLITNNIAKKSREYFRFYEAILENVDAGMEIIHPHLGERWCLRDDFCWIVASDFYEQLPIDLFKQHLSFEKLSDMINKNLSKNYDYNNDSIAIILNIDDKKILFTGDAEEPQELALIRCGLLEKVDVLKAGHHGSKSSTSSLFLSTVEPENFVISCGFNNSYGHPHAVTMDRVMSSFIHVWRTDLQGKIKYWKSENGLWEWLVENPL